MSKRNLPPEHADWLDPNFMSGGARRALKHYSRRSLVGFLVLLVGVALAIHGNSVTNQNARVAIVKSGKALAVDGCNRDFQAIGRQRGLLLRAQAASEKEFQKGHMTVQQHALAVKFYSEELSHIPLPDCRKARNILTDDPNAPIRVPTPLHPPDASVKKTPPTWGSGR